MKMKLIKPWGLNRGFTVNIILFHICSPIKLKSYPQLNLEILLEVVIQQKSRIERVETVGVKVKAKTVCHTSLTVILTFQLYRTKEGKKREDGEKKEKTKRILKQNNPNSTYRFHDVLGLRKEPLFRAPGLCLSMKEGTRGIEYFIVMDQILLSILHSSEQIVVIQNV